MLFAFLDVVGLGPGDEAIPGIRADQVLRHAHRPRSVLDVHHRAGILRIDFDRRVHRRGGGPADQQRYGEALPFHLLGHVDHLVQRWGDQPGQANHIRAVFPRGVENLLRRRHDAQIHHLEVVALEHHADDVFADVVDIALDRGQHDPAVAAPLTIGLFRLDKRNQVSHGFFHHPRRFHHLRQEHLAGAEQVADHVHAVHQWSFDDLQRPVELLAGFLGVSFDKFVNALDQRVFQPFGHRPGTPFLLFLWRG